MAKIRNLPDYSYIYDIHTIRTLMKILLFFSLCFGILAGRNATTDGYVYLGHNEDQSTPAMLNIYNVPANDKRCAYLWFEFPGQKAGDSYVNEYGVGITSDMCKSREDKATGSIIYEVRTTVAQKARTSREAVHIIGALVEKYGYGDSGRSYLVADRHEAWVCAVVKGKHWVAQRVPDDEIATIPNYYTIGKIDLADTVNFLGSKDIVRYARKRGWYRPRRDGEFNFRLAYSDPATLNSKSNHNRHALAQETFFGDAILGDDVPFSRKPMRKFHRKALSQLLTEEPIRNNRTVLTTIFTMNPNFASKNGTTIWVGYPGQDAASQSQWTISTKSPDCCHRYATADEALEKHFSDTGDFREKWPDHFYWHYLYPETDMDVVPHDFTVYVPKQPLVESKRDLTAIGDTYNDHFHVLEDPSRGLLYAFWTQGSYEAANDVHIVFTKSTDSGRTWAEPVMLAGSPSMADPKPVATYQQPMLSRSGRLYCLWVQETTVKKNLCGVMRGMYSDDGGQTWSEPETVPFPIRFETDPEDPSMPPLWCLWQRPLRLGAEGKFIAGCSRYDRNDIPRVEFWQYDNIDEDPEVKDIKISFFNTGKDAFDAEFVKNDHDYTPKDGLSVEEACIVGLSDGRLFAVMRTSIGHPIWSVSQDDGQHWSRPEILRTKDDGPAILQPRSPCPIYDYAGPEARSGNYFLMVHDFFDFDGVISYQNRGPLYKRNGTFVPGAHQPVWFGDPEVFSPRDTGNSFYTSYTALNGEGILWYGDHKFYLFGKVMKPKD